MSAAGPVIYELNTAAWLFDVGRRAGRDVTLADVPPHEWDEVIPNGIDMVWLMGVWERSPAGRAIALRDERNVASWRTALADLRDDDVIGSAYCVCRYEVDARFGGRKGLAAARRALAARGVQLMVDFVPNHVAPDHQWVEEHPGYFVQGSAEDVERDPGAFMLAGGQVVACGRDPYFDPWHDVVQLDAFAPALRAAAAETLNDIAVQADAVRCDMAMLLLNEVFTLTWGARVGDAPPTEYWSDVIGAVRAAHPTMLFVAEAYWDLEWKLLQLGFDHCYDKRLYDRLVATRAADVRAHLGADVAYQQGMVRFLENHDEPRVAAELAPERERAAALAIATLPGATLWHEGQFEGWRIRLPVFLRRRPIEPDDVDLHAFHLRVLAAAPRIRQGEWALCTATGWPDNTTCEQLLTWCWADGGARSLVIVNDADSRASARVHVPWLDVAGRVWRLTDLLSGAAYEREGNEIALDGLYVELPAWGCHALTWEPATS